MKNTSSPGSHLDPARHHDLGAGADREHDGPVAAAPAAAISAAALFGYQIRVSRAAHRGRGVVTGVLASNILGQRLLLFWEYLLGRIPVVKTIYTASNR